VAKKLLVADDSLTIQKVIRLALAGSAASAGETYDIQAVSDGNDAIQQIALFRPDIVLIDVSLPGKSSFEVKRAINEHRDLEEIRFVLMSSAFEKVDEKQVQEVEFHGRLTKPFDPAHLREVLSQVLAQIQNKHREPTASLRPPLPPIPSSMPPSPSGGPPPLPPQVPINTTSPMSIEDDQEGPMVPSFMPDMQRNRPTFPPPGYFNTPQQPPQLPPQMPREAPPQAPPQLPPDLPAFDEPQVDFQAPPDLPSLYEESDLPPPPPMPPSRTNSTRTMSGAPAQAPPRSVGNVGNESDFDIRNLTESTIRMAGLEDFEWSVQEPSLKVPAAMSDDSRENFTLGPSQDYPDLPDMPDLHSQMGTPMPPAAIELSLEDAPLEAEYEPYAMEESTAPAPQISTEQIEEIVRREVERIFKEVAQRVLPEVAERLIKEEIRKLLSEQPGS
jgi:CheY-like chemotaxis protein